jgi:hypothetical protein
MRDALTTRLGKSRQHLAGSIIAPKLLQPYSLNALSQETTEIPAVAKKRRRGRTPATPSPSPADSIPNLTSSEDQEDVVEGLAGLSKPTIATWAEVKARLGL